MASNDAYPSFAALFQQSRYLMLLNPRADARVAIDAIVEAAEKSGPALDGEIAALLAESNWRNQLVGAAAVVVSGASPARLSALWRAIDGPCWTSPQLIAAASVVDPDFDAKARQRLDRGDFVDLSPIAMARRGPNVPLGPTALRPHSAKSLAAFLRLCELRPSAALWIGQYTNDAALQSYLAKEDQDGGGSIAASWLQTMTALLPNR